MKRLFCLLASLVIPAVILTGVSAHPALAQEKAKDAKSAPAEKGKAVQKVLVDNDKVRVFEITFKPGDQGNPNVKRPARVVRALKGGTLTVVYEDGKKETRTFKTGEVKYYDAETSANTLKNEGKSDIVLYAVFLKEPKK